METPVWPFKEKINRYARNLLDKASELIAERLGTEVLQIPISMEAPGIRLVLLPEYEGYDKTWAGADKLQMDIINQHNIICVISPVQNELYLRLSANIYNELTDYVKIADLILNGLRKTS
ncbi:uncharacterized protein LOC134282183 [Saccostrea cucullata]|uniref:uncharacterized protein LOC134282183 n=1 Tax=Saccostrea cuccullata TaxID=36930 RepID=UPI002ED548CA